MTRLFDVYPGLRDRMPYLQIAELLGRRHLKKDA